MKRVELQSFRTQTLNHKLCCLFIVIRKEAVIKTNQNENQQTIQQAVWGCIAGICKSSSKRLPYRDEDAARWWHGF